MAKVKADCRQNATTEEKYLLEIENDIYQLKTAIKTQDKDAIAYLMAKC